MTFFSELNDQQLIGLVFMLILQLVIVFIKFLRSESEERLSDLINYNGSSTADILSKAKKADLIEIEKGSLSSKSLNTSRTYVTVLTILDLKTMSFYSHSIAQFLRLISYVLSFTIITASYVLLVAAFFLSDLEIIDVAQLLYFSALLPIFVLIILDILLIRLVSKILLVTNAIYKEDFHIYRRYTLFKILGNLDIYLYPFIVIGSFLNPFSGR